LASPAHKVEKVARSPSPTLMSISLKSFFFESLLHPLHGSTAQAQ
jgi:hypothetical protein